MALRTMANGAARAELVAAMVGPRTDDRADQRRLMPPRLRLCVYAIFGSVWLSGCVWWVLHRYFAVPGDFGTVRHPWEPTVAWLHGVLAIATAFMFGWVMARHGSEAWQQRKRRLSGGALTAIVAVLSITGFALFFVAEGSLQTDAAGAHEILGLLVTAFAAEHWRATKVRDAR